MNKPKLYPVVICWSLAAIVWQFFGDRYIAAEVLLFLLIGAGGLWGIDWLLYTMARRWRDFNGLGEDRRLRIIEAQTAHARLIAGMDADHLAALGKYRAEITTIAGTGMEPLRVLTVGDRRIDYEFVDEFLRAGSMTHLAALRRWSDGSSKRLDAEALTGFMLANRFASPAVGNQPAAWWDRTAGLAAIGLEE